MSLQYLHKNCLDSCVYSWKILKTAFVYFTKKQYGRLDATLQSRVFVAQSLIYAMYMAEFAWVSYTLMIDQQTGSNKKVTDVCDSCWRNSGLVFTKELMFMSLTEKYMFFFITYWLEIKNKWSSLNYLKHNLLHSESSKTVFSCYNNISWFIT